MNLFTYDKPLYKITKPIRLIELFAGYGSQSLALKYLGIEHENYKVVEFDKYAIQSYNEIHDTDFPLLDITEIKGKDLEIKDTDKYEYIMTYSFPCQDLSLAGKGAGMSVGTRSGLLWEVERLLNEVEELPQILLMENVPQVIGKKNIEHFSKWVEFLESKGYKNYHQNLIATDYGIPQTRNRTFMISILGNYRYDFPKPIPLELKLKDFLEDNVEEKYYLSEDLMNKINVHTNGTNYIQWDRIGGELEMWSRAWKNISPTINTNCQKTKTILNDNPLRIRKLTPKECFRLMGVKDKDYEKLTCSNSQKYKQAGNSIVVNVLMAIFKELT